MEGRMAALDWGIVALYMLAVLGVGVFLSKRVGKNISEYFIGGRKLPWWIAGTSMVATTFAADTPLWVTGEIARHGIAGNWFWWNTILSGFWGVVLTDLGQFALAMIGSVALAIIAVGRTGGVDGLIAGLTERFGDAGPILAFVPDVKTAGWMPLSLFLVFLCVN
ncbi:MAG: hypothetical protein P9M14_08375 [Candidatus Alcyoniella australis]|nr:hypothetical protein [Candidatus Alcyoniella australis]